jgi:hypothetical protein
MTQRFLIYLLLLFTAFLVGLFNLKKLSRPYKLLTIFLLITFISESVTRVFIKEFRNSCPPYHIYQPLQYFFITAFYLSYLKKSTAIISWSWVLFTLFTILNLIFFQNVWTVPTNAMLPANIAYVLCALLLFKNMLQNTDEQPLLRQGLFWYNTSTLVLFTFNFFCWSFYNVLLKTKNSTLTLSDITYVLNMQYYLTTGIAIYLDSRRKQNEQ